MCEITKSTNDNNVDSNNKDKEDYYHNSPEFLCLTSDGAFVQVKIACSTRDAATTTPLKLEIVHSWHTKQQSGTSCFCITQSGCIVVGYCNGQVEAWRDEKRLWTGHFEDYPTIRSMAQLPVQLPPENAAAAADNATTMAEYIVMTLEPSERTATASMVEVIKLSDDMMKLVPGGSSNNNNKTNTLALEDYWVVPEAGHEILDATTLSESHRRQQENARPFATTPHWIPSHGSHAVTGVPGTDKLWVEVADGSIIFLEAGMRNDELSWGVQGRTQGQYLLGYPSIGRGVVTLEGTLHAACALRGATVYFLSLDPPTAASGQGIKSCFYPDDISIDAPLQHLQAFVAGDVTLPLPSSGGDKDDNDEAKQPLLFFCWPGGIVDVYCANLLPSAATTGASVDEMAPLVANGAADELKRLLQCLACSSSDNSQLLADPMWNDAHEEVMAWTAQNESGITLVDMESGRLDSFRKLLRRLADPSYAV